MSLLNQVLHDLEQGKLAKPSDSNSIFDQIKASSPTETKSKSMATYSLLIIIIIAIAFASYKFTQPSITTQQIQTPFIETTSNTASSPILAEINTTSINSIAQIELENELVGKPSKVEPASAIITTIIDSSRIVPPIMEELINDNITVKEIEISQAKPEISEAVTTTIKNIEKVNVIDKKIISTPVKEPVVSPPPTKAIKITTLSPHQKADRLFSKAQKTRSLNEKEILLQQVLMLNSGHIEGQILMAHTYLQQGSIDNAIHTLESSLQLMPNNIELTKALAGLLLKNKQAVEALDRLLNISSHTIKDEHFLNLLAAAYQQNKFTDRAAQSYEKLLKINPDKAEYWLGLAVSLESQKQHNDALVAYRRALALNSLRPAVMTYITQRINSLN